MTEFEAIPDEAVFEKSFVPDSSRQGTLKILLVERMEEASSERSLMRGFSRKGYRPGQVIQLPRGG